MKPRARYSAIRATRRPSKALKGYMMMAATAATLLTFAVFAFINRPAATDTSHCMVGTVPGTAAYFLIDLTDRQPLTPSQFNRVKSEINAAAASLADADRLEISILVAPKAGGVAALNTIYSGCRPLSPTQASLSRGKRVVEKQLKADWFDPIESAIATIGSHSGPPANSTPLIGSIKSLLQRSEGRNKRLTVFSDLLEHDALSLYLPIGEFESLRTAHLDATLVDGLLANVDVDIFQIVSPQNAAHQARAQKFWDDWLAAAGGRVRFSRI